MAKKSFTEVGNIFHFSVERSCPVLSVTNSIEFRKKDGALIEEGASE